VIPTNSIGILKIPATRGKRSWGILELERNDAVELGVLGFVDNAHATFTELFENLEVRYRLSNHGQILSGQIMICPYEQMLAQYCEENHGTNPLPLHRNPLDLKVPTSQ
jgi:hypothetical protein